MTLPLNQHRKTMRLQGYDYSQAGGYYVTIVTQGQACLFGEIQNDEMILNDAGKMVIRWWSELASKFPSITPDAFIVMPNLFHGIIIIQETVGADLRVGLGGMIIHDGMKKGEHIGSPLPKNGMNGNSEMGAHTDAPLHETPRVNPPLSQIVQWFKTMTTNEYIRGVKQSNLPRFTGKLWQRNYYEHIIRNEQDYERIVNYIESNPSNWAEDEENW